MEHKFEKMINALVDNDNIVEAGKKIQEQMTQEQKLATAISFVLDYLKTEDITLYDAHGKDSAYKFESQRTILSTFYKEAIFVSKDYKTHFAGSREQQIRQFFHELAHSTGPEWRLNRQTMQDMAKAKQEDETGESDAFKEAYAKEEMIAEFASMKLMANFGIGEELFDEQIRYIGGYWTYLGGKVELVEWAQEQAEEAVGYIINSALKGLIGLSF